MHCRAHANTTMKNHFRPDYIHGNVVDYDTITGKWQQAYAPGYSHERGLDRGQAWALYAYTMCYRATKDPAYLNLPKCRRIYFESS